MSIYNDTTFISILAITALAGVGVLYIYREIVLRLLIAASIVTAIAGGIYACNLEPEKITIEKIVPVEKPEETLEQLLQEVPQAYGVPEIVARNIVKQESNGNLESIRFEPSQMARAAKITKNPEQQRMYASSHCWFQVMGWHSPSLGIKWMDLYNPRTCAEAGMKILSDCISRAKANNKYDKYFQALTCYNGSEKYAREVMAAISREIVEKNL